MSLPAKIVDDERPLNAAGTPWPIVRGQRPSFQISDLWRAPFHDFPIRDEILYQCLPLSPGLDVLEIGPGSGFTAFRLSREVRHVSLLDVSVGAIRQLQSRLQHIPNLSFFCADLCAPGLKDLIKKEFDAVIGLAVVHLLADPATALKNLADVVSRGGRLVLQFPNYPPPKGTGITFFPHRWALDRMLEAAGFESWAIFAIPLRAHAQFVFEQFHERPLRALRRLGSRNGNKEPLTYQATWAFQKGKKLEPLKYLMHAGWTVFSGAVHAGGDAFELLPLGEEILNRNLLLLARR